MGIKTRLKPYIDWLSNNSINFKNISNKNYVIINPGCSKQNYKKKWPAENFAELCSFLFSKVSL